MVKKPKRPPASAGRRIPASPVQPPLGSFFDKTPKFSFTNLDAGDYGLRHCTRTEKIAVLETLLRLSKLTWGQIWNSPKEALGAEPLPLTGYKNIPANPVFKGRKFIVFRFSDKGRLIGYHEGDAFYPVFCDRNHEFY